MKIALWIALVLAVAVIAAAGYLLYRFLNANWSKIVKSDAENKAAAEKAVASDMRVSEATIVVITAPSQSNPATSAIERVINAAVAMHGAPAKVVVALDGTNAPDTDYDEFLRRLRERMPFVTVVRSATKGGRTGTIETALKHVSTRFVLLLKDDSIHTVPIDLRPLMRVIENEHNQVQHIRFNTVDNWQYQQEEEQQMLEGTFDGVQLTSTPLWSDEDHICLTEYYLQTVLPITRKSGTTEPERAMDPLNKAEPGKYGTFVVGHKTAMKTSLKAK
jgi:hypothetical protein